MKSQKTLAAATMALLAVFALLVAAPVSGGQKLKNKKKEKRFEPVVKQRVEEYAGRYVGIMPDYYLEVAATADGTLSVTSQEGKRRATLRDIRLAGARLTATRVYSDGTTKEFEATFANRIMNGESSFGIIVENVEVEFEDMTFTSIFYRLDTN
ncbi:MAG: hypothetical protein LC803_18005 [Acidobacteria bacterium]|nr:hypothetical protein [Acidobacteriota bacterium]